MKQPTTVRTPLCCLGAGVLLCCLGAVSLCVGSYPLSLQEILTLLTGGLRDTMQAQVFFTLRLPRTAMAAIAGLALGLAGGVYQTVFRTPWLRPISLGWRAALRWALRRSSCWGAAAR